MTRCPPRVSCRWLAQLLLLACFVQPCVATDEARWVQERKALLAEIQRDAASTADSTGRARFSARVIGALDAVPRHRFVPANQVRNAYANRPLPIGHGQTISQPYIVALMTELLAPKARRGRRQCNAEGSRDRATITQDVEDDGEAGQPQGN